MQLNIPDKINILSTEYTVKRVNSLQKVSNSNSCLGEIDYTEKTIKVYGENEIDVLKTLSHELLHAIVHEFSIQEISKHDNEERIVDSLSNALVDTIIRNNLITVDIVQEKSDRINPEDSVKRY